MRWGPVALVGLLALAGVALAGDSRPAAVAGSWYPAEPQELAALVDELLSSAPAPAAAASPVRALLVPHAAYRWSGAAAAAAFRQVAGRSVQRVILLGPSHRARVRGLSLPREDAFQTPLGAVPLDLEALARLRGATLTSGPADAHRLEHSLEAQLPFLQRALAPGWRLVPLLVGTLEGGEDAEVADLLRPLLDEETLLVVSGDFTHYGEAFGYRPFPPDERAAERLRDLDLGLYARLAAADAPGMADYGERTGITACALAPARILAGLMPPGATVERVAYYRSADRNRDYRHSVSYLAAVVRWGPGTGRAQESPPAARQSGPPSESDLAYLQTLAATTVEAAAAPGNGAQERLERLLADPPPELHEPAGLFVTLLDGQSLRGCIGSVEATRPLYLAAVTNAVAASRHDPRFPPVSAEEAPRLAVHVSVLSPPRRIGSWEEFEVGRHGVVLSKDGRRAVFLPEVPLQQGWGREETLSQLSRKAGLASDAWRNGAELAVFTSRRYPPAPPD